ncbi:MAG TPA: galactokinase family protein [Kiritimatiellia bacterium]|nr:galactokinase family protein [Kiritimatiellia bacterium]
MTRPLVVSAPGSLMLLGEHAVLHGYPCLVAAINRRVRVAIIPRNDGLVTIESELGHYEGERDDLEEQPDFRFMLAALRHYADVLPGGLDAVVQADMPATIGFGTSAAVTAASCGALYAATHGDLDRPTILRSARSVIRNVQGRGSGADAAASVFGGVVQYRQDDDTPTIVSRHAHPITALYCGYKTPTATVIAWVEEGWRTRNEDLARLYEKIGATAEAGAGQIHDPIAFGHCLDEGQRLMRELGVSTDELEACILRLKKMPGICGAKISGSGLGDCVIGWGRAPEPRDPPDGWNILTALEGVRLE